MAARGTAVRGDSKLIALDDVPGLVPDGSSVYVGGFSMFRSPLGMVRELARAGRKRLTLLSHIDGPASEMLLSVGALSTIRSSYVGLDQCGIAPQFNRAVREGTVEFVEETEGTMIFGMKAAIYRLPYLPSRALIGTDIVTVRDDLIQYTDPISGEELVAMPAISMDVALIHAQRADLRGNVQIQGTLCIDVEAAKVADFVIVSVEEIVDTEDLLATGDSTRIPSHLVDAIVHLPGGAYPSSCVPFYEVDLEYFMDYTAMVAAGQVSEYVDTHIRSAPFADYVVGRRVPLEAAQSPKIKQGA